jgi:hypothetical protein
MTDNTDNSGGNPFVAIAGSIGGLSVGVVALIAIFSSENLVVAAWVVGALAAMGAVLGSMALKKEIGK